MHMLLCKLFCVRPSITHAASVIGLIVPFLRLGNPLSVSITQAIPLPVPKLREYSSHYGSQQQCLPYCCPQLIQWWQQLWQEYGTGIEPDYQAIIIAAIKHYRFSRDSSGTLGRRYQQTKRALALLPKN